MANNASQFSNNQQLSHAWTQNLNQTASSKATNREMIRSWKAQQQNALNNNNSSTSSSPIDRIYAAADAQRAKGQVSPELEQIILRVRIDTMTKEKTIDAQNSYLDSLEALLEDVMLSDSKDDHAPALSSLKALRKAQQKRTDIYREHPLYKTFPHFLKNDEHTNLFVQHAVSKYIMYPVKRVQIECALLRDDLEELSRVDLLALRVLQLTDSLYSVLILRRLFMDYGITTTARVTPPEDEFMNDESNTSLFSTSDTSSTTASANTSAKRRNALDDKSLVHVLCQKDPYVEMANEAQLCANHIENGIANQSNPNGSQNRRPGQQWYPHVPEIDQDFNSDHVEMFDTDTTQTKYSKSRNFLVEEGLTGADGDVGDMVYLKELLCDTLADTKRVRYGRYRQSHRHEGHFCGITSDPLSDASMSLPRQTATEEAASLFGERKKCPHGKGCDNRKNSIDQHRTQREWYYRTEINPHLTPQEKQDLVAGTMKKGGDGHKFTSRVVCSACMNHENVSTQNPYYLQNGHGVARATTRTVINMQNIMAGRVVRKDVGVVNAADDAAGEAGAKEEEAERRKKQTVDAQDGGLIFAMIRAKTMWKNLVKEGAHQDEIEIAEQNYQRLAAETASVIESVDEYKDGKNNSERGVYGRKNRYGKFFQSSNLTERLRESNGTHSAVDNLFDNTNNNTNNNRNDNNNEAGYLQLLEVLNVVRRGEEEEKTWKHGELLLGKLRELHRKKLLKRNVIDTNIDDDGSSDDEEEENENKHTMYNDMSSEEEPEDGSGEDAEEEENDNKDDQDEQNHNKETKKTSHNLAKRKFASRSMKKKNSKKKVLDMTVQPIPAKDLGLDVALHTDTGKTLLNRAFWLIKELKIDHFGKRQHGKIWPDEMKRVIKEETKVLSEENIQPRHSTVMWRLRDGFERFEEKCYTHSTIGGSSNSGGSAGNGGSMITRRCFNLYFGHIFTMSEKQDWSPKLHSDYLELMIQSLLKTREIILAETLSTELWTEIENRGVVQAEGIARLGYAITSRPVATSEAVDELWAADEDGNNMMSSNEYLKYSAEKYLKDVGPDAWHRVHGVYGNIAHRMRRNVGVSLEPYDNLLLARRGREELDNACIQLILKEKQVEVILSKLLDQYDIEECRTRKERKDKKNKLAIVCQKYHLRWGWGDLKDWDYDYGHSLLKALAERIYLENE